MNKSLQKKYKDAKVHINASLFYAASSIASKQDWREYLNGIFITPANQGGINIIATDGHRLIYLWDQKGFSSCKDILLPFRELRELVKLSRSPKNRNEIIKIKSSRTKLIALLKNKSFKFNFFDGTYPSIRNLVQSLPMKPIMGGSTLYSSKYISDYKYILENRRSSKKNNVAIHIGLDGHFLAASKFGFYLTMPLITHGEHPYKNMFDFIYDIVTEPDDVLLKALHKEKSIEGYKFLKDILNSDDVKVVKNNFNP